MWEEQCTFSNPCLDRVVTHFVGYIQKVGHIQYQHLFKDRKAAIWRMEKQLQLYDRSWNLRWLLSDASTWELNVVHWRRIECCSPSLKQTFDSFLALSTAIWKQASHNMLGVNKTLPVLVILLKPHRKCPGNQREERTHRSSTNSGAALCEASAQSGISQNNETSQLPRNSFACRVWFKSVVPTVRPVGRISAAPVWVHNLKLYIAYVEENLADISQIFEFL